MLSETEVEPRSEKQIALEALQRMPEVVTLQEISRQMAILAAIRLGEAAAEDERVLTHEEVKRRSAGWISS